MTNIYLALGENIRRFRKTKGLSTPDLAKQLNISTGLLNNIENGRHDVFKLELLFNIMENLDVSLSELLPIHSINIRDLSFQQQIYSFYDNSIPSSNQKINYLNNSINKILVSYLAVLSNFNYDDIAVDYITKHIIDLLNLIKDVNSMKSEVPS